jgi:hypothetical protein
MPLRICGFADTNLLSRNKFLCYNNHQGMPNLPPTNIFLLLTERFNKAKLRAVISSGQAVVLYGLAMMSKDGDWIVREDQESFDWILTILEEFGARYRFGAPLDIGWHCGGWSSHFELKYQNFRVRADFVSRPPRVSAEMLTTLWQNPTHTIPVVPLEMLAALKKTNREKDYVIIGELARQMKEIDAQLLFSRSSRDLLEIAEKFPERISSLVVTRPLLKEIAKGEQEALEIALDAERRALIKVNEHRLAEYSQAARGWMEQWAGIERQAVELPLRKAHALIVNAAEKVLPKKVP